jgi:HAD superfamily hydrolase (TIGR01493 family)
MTPYGPERAVTRIAGVQAVLFDTFGTVVDWRSGVTASVQQTADIHHVPLDAAAFADAWRAKYEPSMRPIRTGDRPFTRLSRLHRENLTATLAEFGLDITPNEVDRLNHAWQRLAPWPDSVEGLRLLSATSSGRSPTAHRPAHPDGQAGESPLGRDHRRGPHPAVQAAPRGLLPRRRHT